MKQGDNVFGNIHLCVCLLELSCLNNLTLISCMNYPPVRHICVIVSIRGVCVAYMQSISFSFNYSFIGSVPPRLKVF